MLTEIQEKINKIENRTLNMKYYENLDLLTKRESYKNIDQDKIFEEIEELEKRFDHKKAANLLSIYINFAMHKNDKILINKSRRCVELLIEANLINFQEAGEDAIYIFRTVILGKQSTANYTL